MLHEKHKIRLTGSRRKENIRSETKDFSFCRREQKVYKNLRGLRTLTHQKETMYSLAACPALCFGYTGSPALQIGG